MCTNEPNLLSCLDKRVPVTFNLAVPGLGHLAGGGAADLPSGARLDIPFWMAEPLLLELGAGGGVTLQRPRAYGQRVQNALDASGPSVDLRRLSPAWYAVGARLSAIANELADPVQQAYESRLPALWSAATHLSTASMAVFSAPAFCAADGYADAGAGSADLSMGGAAALSAAGAGGGSSALTQEMSDFLHGLDDREQAVLGATNAANNLSRAYLTS